MPVTMFRTIADSPAVAERSNVLKRYGSAAFRVNAAHMTYSPDGRWIAAAEERHDVHLMDAKTGETKAEFSATRRPVKGFAFSPNGQSLAVYNSGGVGIWDIKERKFLRRAEAETTRNIGNFQSFANSPDREWRATWNSRGEILLTKWDQITPLYQMDFRRRNPILAVGKEGKWIAAAVARSPIIHVWKGPKFDTALEWKTSDSPIQSLANSQDGKTLYSGAQDGTLHAWDIEQGRARSPFVTVNPSPITALILSPDGKLLATASREEATVYEIETSRALRNITFDRPRLRPCLALSPQGTVLAIASSSRPIELWDVKTGRALHRPSPTIENVFVTKDRRRFGSIHGPDVDLWNRKTGKVEESFHLSYHPKDGSRFIGASVLHGAEQLVLGTPDDEVLYRDLASQQSFQRLGRLPLRFESPRAYSGQGYAAQLLGPGAIRLSRFRLSPYEQPANFRVDLKGSTSTCLQFDFSEDGKTFAAAYEDRSVLIWETQTGKRLGQLKLDATPRQILLNSDGRWLAVSQENSVEVWDWKAAKRIHQKILDKNVNRHVMAFGYQDDLFATANSGQPIQVWNLKAGKMFLTLDAPESSAESLAFSRDDKQLALGLHDKTIRVFDLKRKKADLTLKGHRGVVTHILFGPGGKRMVSASNASEIFHWDIETGRGLSSRQGISVGAGRMVLSADGDLAIFGGRFGQIHRYSITGSGRSSSTGDAAMNIADFAYCQKTQMLAVANRSGIRLWDRKADRELPFVVEDDLSHVEWAGSGCVLMAASKDIFGWDVEQQKEVYRIPAAQLQGPVTSMAKSPNGGMIATAHFDRSVCFWDPETGRLIREVSIPGPFEIKPLQFSADGRLLFGMAFDTYFAIEAESGLIWFQKPNTSNGRSFAVLENHRLLIAELQGTAREESWAPQIQSEIQSSPETLWGSLSTDDGPTVFRAMFALADLEDETVEFLARHLPEIKGQSTPTAKVTTLIKNLDNPSPEIQRRASRELRELGQAPRSQLEAALKDKNLSARAKTRIQLLLKAQNSDENPHLPAIRAVQLLEWIGTPKSKRLLEDWSKKHTDRIGREAQAALDRLSGSRRENSTD